MKNKNETQEGFHISRKDLYKIFEFISQAPTLGNSRWATSDYQENNPRVIICAPPKSGSTWATNILAKSLNVSIRRLCYAWSSNEHDLYVPSLVKFKGQGFISQLHMKATPHNIVLLKDFSVRPIILTRNVFDSVVSFSRDLRKKIQAKKKTQGVLGYSFVWLTDHMDNFSEDEIIDYSIDYYLPWYMNFLRSWDAHHDKCRPVFCRYEDLKEHPSNVFEEIIFDIVREASISKIDFTTKFGSSALMSQTNSEKGDGYNSLKEAQIHKIRSYFLQSDSAWVLSHLQIP